MDDNITIINEDDWNEALNDPKVHKLLEDARKLADDLVARGHCRCHLVVNCPDKS